MFALIRKILFSVIHSNVQQIFTVYAFNLRWIYVFVLREKDLFPWIWRVCSKKIPLNFHKTTTTLHSTITMRGEMKSSLTVAVNHTSYFLWVRRAIFNKVLLSLFPFLTWFWMRLNVEWWVNKWKLTRYVALLFVCWALIKCWIFKKSKICEFSVQINFILNMKI